MNPDERNELARHFARSIAVHHLEQCLLTPSPSFEPVMTFTFADTVLPTPKAAVALGISVSTLNRFCSDEVSMFKQGEHWNRRTPYPNATKLFNLRLCVETMQRLGYAIPPETLEVLNSDE